MRSAPTLFVPWIWIAALFVGGSAPGCGSSSAGNMAGDAGAGAGDSGMRGFGVGDAAAMCGVRCQQVACPNGGSTNVTGTVFAPTKLNPDPLYNAIVYVPNSAVLPFTPGVTCDKCGTVTSGDPVTTALTGPDGKFTLSNVPAGDDIPLVVQLGRWRRQVVIPHVAACTSTAIDASLTRLPRNKTEGDIPLTAISTGSADALECVLRKMGVEDAEFTIPSGGGRIQLYVENGASTPSIPPASSLYASSASLDAYDIVIFDCEGAQNDKSAAARKNVLDYTSAGGRVFASHFSYVWLYDTVPFAGTATWDVDQPHPNDPMTGLLDTSFPKGMAFDSWLKVVGAESSPEQVEIHVPRHDADAVVAPTQRWIYSQAPDDATLQHFTFNTPIGAGADQQCGRVVFSDFHVTGTNGSTHGQAFPLECDNGPLTPQEKVLEFMMFDLASCIQTDGGTPVAPPVVK